MFRNYALTWVRQYPLVAFPQEVMEVHQQLYFNQKNAYTRHRASRKVEPNRFNDYRDLKFQKDINRVFTCWSIEARLYAGNLE